jgi:hypothetical protein
MDKVLVNTHQLIGVELDWAVANYVTGALLAVPCSPVDALAGYSPSTRWQHGGPLIDEYIGELVRNQEGFSEPLEPWYADCDVFWQIGGTALVAVCRAVLAKKVGQTIAIPRGLCDVHPK